MTNTVTFNGEVFNVSEYRQPEKFSEAQLTEIREWQAALRSGKYGQTTGCLKRGCNFCCLGVYSEIKDCLNNDEHFLMTDEERKSFYDENGGKDPICETDKGDYYVPHINWLIFKTGISERIYLLNDVLKFAFDEIADFLDVLISLDEEQNV